MTWYTLPIISDEWTGLSAASSGWKAGGSGSGEFTSLDGVTTTWRPLDAFGGVWGDIDVGSGDVTFGGARTTFGGADVTW